MIWAIPLPFIWFFTFKEIYLSGFPGLYPDSKRGFLEWAGMLFFACLISSLISLVPLGIGALIGSTQAVVGEKDREYPLVALREKDGFSGHSYFLGAGFIRDEQYYFWYRREEGSIRGGKTLRSPHVRIYQGNETPLMVTFKTHYSSPWARDYLWLVGFDMRSGLDWFPDFYIPEGSIKEGFSL